MIRALLKQFNGARHHTTCKHSPHLCRSCRIPAHRSITYLHCTSASVETHVVHGYTTQAFINVDQKEAPKMKEDALKAARRELAAIVEGKGLLDCSIDSLFLPRAAQNMTFDSEMALR